MARCDDTRAIKSPAAASSLGERERMINCEYISANILYGRSLSGSKHTYMHARVRTHAHMHARTHKHILTHILQLCMYITVFQSNYLFIYYLSVCFPSYLSLSFDVYACQKIFYVATSLLITHQTLVY